MFFFETFVRNPRIPVGLCLPVLLLISVRPAVSQGVISTLAGNGVATFSGDGGIANRAAVNHPKGIAVDAAGNVYVADSDNRRVRQIRPDGTIRTVAGTGFNGFSGDGGLATNAAFSNIMDVAVDAAGNIFVADVSNRRIRRFSVGGIVTTIAGTGVEGFSGDGGQAINAMLGGPTSLVFDQAGNLFFTDASNQRIRRIDTAGRITTIAGTGLGGFSGDGGSATAAMIQFPLGVAVDASGNVYFADGDNARVRRVNPQGIIITIAGNGRGGYSGDGGRATLASINIPSDVAVDLAGNVYVADAGNNRVRKVDTQGTITTVAGTGASGFSGDGGPATQAALNYPWGLATDRNGAVYIADRVNSRVRVIAGSGNQNPPNNQEPPANQNPPVGQNPPAITANGVINAASYVSGDGIAPGALAAIFGSNLATGQSVATALPLPTVLGETSVTFNGIPAPILYSSPTQVNVQAPFELGQGAALVQVKRGAIVSSVTAVTVNAVSPGIFVVAPATNTGAIVHANTYALVDVNAPARTNDVLLIFGTGFGLTNRVVASGERAPSAPPFAETLQQPTVTIGGRPATVLFSGLAPGFVGLYQLNVRMPGGLTAGNHPVRVIIGGRVSNSVTLTVAQ